MQPLDIDREPGRLVDVHFGTGIELGHQLDAFPAGQGCLGVALGDLDGRCLRGGHWHHPGRERVLAQLRRDAGARVLLGIGSIRSVEDIRRADFPVSAGSPGPLTEAMLATGSLVLPGVFTPTEVMPAQSLGIRAVKLFPASPDRAGRAMDLARPVSDVGFVPTGASRPQISVDGSTPGQWRSASAAPWPPATLDRGVDSSTLAGRLRDVLDDLSRRAGS